MRPPCSASFLALLSALVCACSIETVRPTRAPPAREVQASRVLRATRERPPERTLTRASLLEPQREDPAVESYMRSHLSAPVRTLSAGKEESLTMRAVRATGRAEVREPADEPELWSGKLGEGERAEIELGAEPGCVTVVVHGGLGVTEVDSFVVEGPQADPHVLGGDRKSGPVAVAGGQGGCVKLRKEPARALVIVRKGAGPVAVGVYRKGR